MIRSKWCWILVVLVTASACSSIENGTLGKATRADAVLLKHAKSGHWQYVHLALQQDGNPQASTTRGTTLLHLAVEEGQNEVGRLLIRKGALLDAIDPDGWTPLMIATKEPNVRAALSLYCAGADPDLATRPGFTARRIGKLTGYDGLVSLFNHAACDPAMVPALQAMGRAQEVLSSGDYLGADSLLTNSCRTIEQLLGGDNHFYGTCLNNLATMKQASGALEEAERLFRQGLEVVVSANGKNAIDVVWLKNNLARLVHARLRFSEAEVIFREALAILDTRGKQFAVDRIGVMSNLGMLLADAGRLDEAQSLYHEALADCIRHEAPPDLIAKIINNLASLFLTKGDLLTANRFFEQAVGVLGLLYMENPVPYLVDLGTTAMNWATVIQSLGDYDGAAVRFDNVVAMLEDAAPDQPILGLAYANRANLHLVLDELVQADSLFSKAMDIYERRLPGDHPTKALGLINQGMVAFTQGHHVLAKDKFEAALAMYERMPIPQLEAQAIVWGNLASVAVAQDDFEAAAGLFDRAFEAYEERGFSENPAISRLLIEKARMLWIRDKIVSEDLLAVLDKATDQFISFAATTLPSLSFAEQLAFLETKVPEALGFTISAATEAGSMDRYYGRFYQWKGRLAQSLFTSGQARQHDKDPESQAVSEELDRIRTELAAWFRQSGTVDPTRFRVRRDSLTAVKEYFERELQDNLDLDLSGDPLASVTFDDFQTVLRHDEVFVDVYKFEAVKEGIVSTDRYGAVISGLRQKPQYIDLGDAFAIENEVLDWLDAVGKRRLADKEWATLQSRIWIPISKKVTKNSRVVWISPDGILSRIPWQLFDRTAAVGAQKIALIDSPRELFRLRNRTGVSEKEPPSRALLLVGGLDFEAGKTKESVSSERYSPLPGTLSEIRAISGIAKTLAVEVDSLVGDQATKTRLVDRLQKSTWVHLATHGFFFRATDIQLGSRSERLRPLTGGPDLVRSRNPLIESGIALSGANIGEHGMNNGLLTAEELIGLDLRSAELVILSACDTGRGTEVTSQGVMGLRTAILAAGARSLLMSLWKVPDEPTSLLMKNFYDAMWLRGKSKYDALTAAQQIVQRKYPEPVNWAGWVLAGEFE